MRRCSRRRRAREASTADRSDGPDCGRAYDRRHGPSRREHRHRRGAWRCDRPICSELARERAGRAAAASAHAPGGGALRNRSSGLRVIGAARLSRHDSLLHGCHRSDRFRRASEGSVFPPQAVRHLARTRPNGSRPSRLAGTACGGVRITRRAATSLPMATVTPPSVSSKFSRPSSKSFYGRKHDPAVDDICSLHRSPVVLR